MVLEMWKRVLLAMASLLFIVAGSFSAVFASGPERPAGYIGSVELGQILDHAHLVDCRSRLEYDVLHMKNAVHIPVATMVREDLERLRAKDPAKAIVFYCNQEDFPKAMDAFVKATKWGYGNIFVYRPGIFNWAKEHPEKVLFFGKILTDGALEQLFVKDHYLAKCLLPSQFVVAARQSGTMVVDIRDMAERHNFPITLANLKHSPIDRLAKLIKSGSRKVMGKKMLIIDSYGAQSQWLQHVFDESGIDYAFLKGGGLAWRQAGLDRFGNHDQGPSR